MFSSILAVMLIGQVLAQEIVGMEEPSDCIQNQNPCVPPESFSGFMDHYGELIIECACPSPYDGPNCKGAEELLDCIKNPCVPPQFFSGFYDYGDVFPIKCACPPPYYGTNCTDVLVQVATASEVLVKSGDNMGSSGGTIFYCCNGLRFSVNDYLVIRAQKDSKYSPVRISAIGFSVRMNGTFLEGKDMKCVNNATGSALGEALYSEDFEFDDQWVNPSVIGNKQGSELKFYDVDDWQHTGDYDVAPDDTLLWLGDESVIYCRINLDDLQDKLADPDNLADEQDKLANLQVNLADLLVKLADLQDKLANLTDVQDKLANLTDVQVKLADLQVNLAALQVNLADLDV